MHIKEHSGRIGYVTGLGGRRSAGNLAEREKKRGGHGLSPLIDFVRYRRHALLARLDRLFCETNGELHRVDLELIFGESAGAEFRAAGRI